jgi:hypothetical protein
VFGGAHEAISACVTVREPIEPDRRCALRTRTAIARDRLLYPTLKELQ